MIVEALAPDGATAHRAALVALLQDAVDGGASLGFLPPLGTAEATVYWESVGADMRAGSRALVVARESHGGRVVGSVQLELAMRRNGAHRAEVAKLMVHRDARRRGIGRALMVAIEGHARGLGRTTLHLDTRQGDPSEALYRSLGWQPAGTIPRWARSADGRLDATVFYYRLLDGA
jgi:acetyltransferase